jgi:hypothetical protein
VRVKGLALAVMVLASIFLATSLRGRLRTWFLPGPTTAGHYQIELACGACHTRAFSDRESMQTACVGCHGAALKAANDSHPRTKFDDPRNADRVAQLDARLCVTCHREHRTELVSEMGLSLPRDYCHRCHATIGDERPSHKGLPFDGCAATGCHNFHDNRALYEDFLAQHLDDPDTRPTPHTLARTSAFAGRTPKPTVDDAPAGITLADDERRAFLASAHARADVGCTGCHAAGQTGWRDEVPTERCGACHDAERDSFFAGRHGMREATGLGPMQVSTARLPMKPEAAHRTMGCTACHGGHAFDTRRAAVDACLGCHADRHSQSYAGSAHATLFAADPTGTRGASCATCHLPRVRWGEEVRVDHNQNDTLRPRDKMARPVCLDCHGLGFALDALADDALVTANFAGPPTRNRRGLDMVRARTNKEKAQ